MQIFYFSPFNQHAYIIIALFKFVHIIVSKCFLGEQGGLSTSRLILFWLREGVEKIMILFEKCFVVYLAVYLAYFVNCSLY